MRGASSELRWTLTRSTRRLCSRVSGFFPFRPHVVDMRPACLAAVLTLLLCYPAHGHQPEQKIASGSGAAATLLAGLGSLHHPVTTSRPEAQKFFDQGLAFVYAFNHPEAVRSFERAAQLDPQMSMAYWGIALALGSNINSEIDAERERAAYGAVQKARALAAGGPLHERRYVEALAKRYSSPPPADRQTLNLEYKNAMGELVRHYPDDLDAATLFAEAAMVLRPWRLWTADGKPGTARSRSSPCSSPCSGAIRITSGPSTTTSTPSRPRRIRNGRSATPRSSRGWCRRPAISSICRPTSTSVSATTGRLPRATGRPRGPTRRSSRSGGGRAVGPHVLQSQPPLSRGGREHGRPILGSPGGGPEARGARRAASQSDARRRGVLADLDLAPRTLPKMERRARPAEARGDPGHSHHLLALRPGHGVRVDR